jgi:hypothetical protein
MYITLITILVNLNSIKYCLANTPIYDLESTSNFSYTEQVPAKIQIQEVSLKNSLADFFTFSVKTSQEKVNLLGLEFYDDKVFKKIEQDFWVKNGDLITLYFNSTEVDSPEIGKLFTPHKGLTSTTEQLIIKTQDIYYDFLCWQKTPISKSENTEWEKIYQEQFWDDSEIDSCINSAEIPNNQNIIRLNSENNNSAWQTKTETPKTSDQSHPETDNNLSKKSPTSKSSTPIIDNESTTPEEADLRITEIYPAPITGEEEWIELENLTTNPINLDGWIIDDQEGGSKPKLIGKKILPARGYLQIKLKELKINLNNSSDQVRIFLPDGQIVASQEYEEIIKGQSFTLTETDGEENWQYTDLPTPGKANLVLTTINGTIIEKAQFGEIYHFTIETKENDLINKVLVIFNEKTIKGPLAQATFTVGSTGNFTGEISPTAPNQNGYTQTLKLHKYQIQSSSEQRTSPPITLIGIITLAVLGIYFAIKKYRQ